MHTGIRVIRKGNVMTLAAQLAGEIISCNTFGQIVLTF